MFVAAARIELHLPASQSLKDRRRIVRSLIDRSHRGFNCAVAEVGALDKWQIAGLGVSIVSSTETHARERLDQVVRFIEQFNPEAIVTSVEIDAMPFED